MENVHTLQARRTELFRAAMNHLNEKGSRSWSGQDQAVYQAFLAAIERTDEQIDRQRPSAGSPFAEYSAKRQALESYIRGQFAVGSVKNTMSTSTGSQGGFTVDAIVVGDIMSALKGYGWMRAVCSEITLKDGANATYPTSDGTAEVGERLAQNASSALLDPTFGAADISATKYGSKIVTVPIELLQDTNVDIVAFIAERAMERIGRIQNADFTTGTGTNQPTGIVTASNVGKTGAAGQVTTILASDLQDLMDSVNDGCLGMPSKTRGQAQMDGVGWMFNSSMRKMLRGLVDAAGRPVWLPGYRDVWSNTFKRPQILDYDVFINNDMPTPAASTKSLLFGNFAKYLVRDVPEIKLHRFDDSAYSMKGQVGFLMFARAGGNLLDAGAVKAYQHPAS